MKARHHITFARFSGATSEVVRNTSFEIKAKAHHVALVAVGFD
jgi:hypothetical protein